MRRVVITGVGAVTPLGHDVKSTWSAAVEGRSGVDFIKTFDTSEYPVHIAAEVKDFERQRARLRQGAEAARPLCQIRALGLEGGDGRCGHQRLPARPRRRRPRVGDRRAARAAAPVRRPPRARARTASRRPSSRTSCPTRPAARSRSPSAFAVRTTRSSRPARPGSHAIGQGADLVRHGSADAVLAGGTEALHPPALLRRLLLDARPRRRGRGSRARLPALRRHARRLRDGRGGGDRHARGARARARARRHDLRRGARLRRLERRVPHGRARSRLGRRRGDDEGRARAGGGRPESRRLHQRARDVDAPRRRSPRRRRSRTSSATTRTSSPSRRRSRRWATSSGPQARSRRSWRRSRSTRR